MEKIKMEEVRRGQGRPKLDAHITEEYAPSRRQELNKMYMYEGVHLLSVAATKIQNSEVLWLEDRTAVTLKSRDGIPHFSLHKLQHYFASKMSALNIPEADIIKMGGWETDYVMKAVYRHSMMEKEEKAKRKASEKLQSAII